METRSSVIKIQDLEGRGRSWSIWGNYSGIRVERLKEITRNLSEQQVTQPRFEPSTFVIQTWRVTATW